MRPKVLSDYISSTMADRALSQKENTLSIPKVPSPTPLRTLFSMKSGAWSISQENIAIDLAKSSNWRECIQTIISSSDGAPLQEPREYDGKFIFFGDVTSAVKLDRKAFLSRLGQWPPVRSDLDVMVRRRFSLEEREEGEKE